MKQKKTLNVGIAQINTIKCDLQRNANSAEVIIRKAADKGADIVCTPECMLDGYGFDDDRFQGVPNKYCLSVESPYIQRFLKLANPLNVYLILGLSFKEKVTNRADGIDDKEIFRNAAILIDPKGCVVGKYFKMHSTYKNLEASFYSHGEKAPVFEIKVRGQTIPIGIMICYDRQMPETARMLSLKGAKVIFNPVATGNFKSRFLPHWNRDQ